MEEQDKIVVFGSFENAMDASLAKTKLDAYGIPCFLTEENLASLYPIQNPRFSVRLHIFEKDEDYVRQVLLDTITAPEEDLTRCPNCNSIRIEMGYTKKTWHLIPSVVFSLFVALFPPKKVSHCQDCHYEF